MEIFRILPVYFDRENMKIVNFIQNIFLSNILSMKYSDFNFYWNRSSRTWFARAIWSHKNEPKMSPGMSCSNGGDHIGLTRQKHVHSEISFVGIGYTLFDSGIT